MTGFGAFLERYRDELPRWRAELDGQARELAELVDSAVIERRVKGPESTWSKMGREGLWSKKQVHDLLGLRLIVDDEADCYRALEQLLRWRPRRVVRVKDYIARPKTNGYQSLHLWLRPAIAAPLEVQIRTHAMQRRCLRGEAAHWRYKRQLAHETRPSPTPHRSVVDMRSVDCSL